MRTLIALLVICNLITLFVWLRSPGHHLMKAADEESVRTPTPDWAFYTNEQHFEAPLNKAGDSMEMFGRLWKSLPPAINVYPSEGYYYFNGFIGNDFVRGNLGFFHDNLDKEEISIYYDLIRADESVEECGRMIGEGDGLKLNLINQRLAVCEYEGKTITVRLRSVGKGTFPACPEDESFLGVSLDESGFQFGLFFNNKRNVFIWVLSPVTRKRIEFDHVKANLYVDPVSRFVFLDDVGNGRYILCGVHEESVFGNSWYDGPFDQLPDHEIQKGDLDLAPYIRRAFPEAGEVTKYGIYISDSETRFAISPYMRYTFPEQVMNYAKATYPLLVPSNGPDDGGG